MHPIRKENHKRRNSKLFLYTPTPTPSNNDTMADAQAHATRATPTNATTFVQSFQKKCIANKKNFAELPVVVRHILIGEKGNITQQEIRPEMVLDYANRKHLGSTDIIDGLNYILENYDDMTYPSNYDVWTIDQLKRAIEHMRGFDYEYWARCWLGIEENPLNEDGTEWKR